MDYPLEVFFFSIFLLKKQMAYLHQCLECIAKTAFL